MGGASGVGSEKFIKSNKLGGRNKRGWVGFFIFLRPKFVYLLQNLPANVFRNFFQKKLREEGKGWGWGGGVGERLFGTKFYQKNLKSKPRPFNTPVRA